MESASNQARQPRRPSRRKFVVAGAGAAVAASAFFIDGLEWTRVGPPETVPETGLFHFVDTERGRGAFLMRDAAGEIYALTQRCSHRGCDVDWKPEPGRFECPCHEGVYNFQGERVSGPPIRGLRRLELRVNEAGLLEVRM